MPGDKFLRNVGGLATEVRATQVTAGAANSGDIVALGDDGFLDASVFPSGFGDDVQVIQTSEAVTAGDFVNIHDVASAFRVRKADAATAKRAHGYVLTGAASGVTVTVYFEGRNSSLTGITPAEYFLSGTIPGGFALVPPAVGLSQKIGIGVSATTINVEIEEPIVLVA